MDAASGPIRPDHLAWRKRGSDTLEGQQVDESSQDEDQLSWVDYLNVSTAKVPSKALPLTYKILLSTKGLFILTEVMDTRPSSWRAG